MAQVKQRLPVLRSAGLCGQFGMLAQMRVNGFGIAEDQCCVERGGGDIGIESEQSFGAAGRAARRAADELVDGGAA